MSRNFKPLQSGALAAAAAVGLVVVLLIGACSSKNPDSLIGMNVDENLAIMDANASSETAAAASSVSDANSTSNRAGAKTDARGTPGNEEGSVEVNAGAKDTGNTVGEDQGGANQIGNDEEPPNGV